ncbi:MAG: hypothetical protein EXX96DRAFT_652130 [Benjaminiella poitrasii]|nr:MAG: hypothetical protein EXX96DRAFT_652130 [Benjaminiella poitrasii]
MAPLNLSLTQQSILMPQNNEICFTKDCITAAAGLLQSLDMNVDPCSDFYQFTCGNWIKNAIIPEELAGYGVLEVESIKNRDRLRTILEGSYNDLLSSTLSQTSFQVTTKENISIDEANFKVLKDYYVSCTDLDADGTLKLATFYEDLDNLQSEIVASESKNSSFTINDKIFDIISYPKSTESLVVEVGGLFTVEIFPDYGNGRVTGISVFPPTELIDDIDIAPLKDQGQELLFNLVASLFSSNNLTNRDRDRISLLEDTDLLSTLSDSDIYAIIDDVISVQSKLLQISKASNADDIRIYTIDESVASLPFIDWKSILQSYIPHNHDISDMKIQVSNMEYFRKLNYFANINDPSRVVYKDGLVNFMLVHKIVRDASKLDKETHQFIPDLPFQTRSSLCVDKILDNFGLVAGRFYAMITLDGESDRLKLEGIVDTIKEALGKRIRNADWLDNSTRQAAIKKLNSMSTSIGYSTSFPDERSPADIHAYLRGLKTNADNFYENEKSVNRWILKNYWKTLGRTVGVNEWIGMASPQVLNAFNLLSKNSVFVSAAFAQKPNYDKTYPDYFNYGGIGQTLGHEFSHGFDDFGSDFDEFGIEKNWWSKETKTKYKSKTECFVNQYSKATIVDEDGIKYSIDGELTLGENIADVEGLSAAYDAYLISKQKEKSHNPILPGLQKFSSEALFFMNAGRSFCSKTSPGTVKDSLSDEHAPDSIRANKIFENNADFAKVFNCPVGSKMNPKSKKCKIW